MTEQSFEGEIGFHSVPCEIDPLSERPTGGGGIPPAATASRQYRMIRLEKGDYLLPSNDAQILWRIAKYDEDDGTKLWGLWRWDGGMPTVDQIAAALDEGMWNPRWEYWDGGYRKRSDVIAYLNKCREGNS